MTLIQRTKTTIELPISISFVQRQIDISKGRDRNIGSIFRQICSLPLPRAVIFFKFSLKTVERRSVPYIKRGDFEWCSSKC